MATFSPCKGCVRLWQNGWYPWAFGILRAVCGLCGRRLAKRFCDGISRGKTTWEAVPQRRFCGSNPAISASRKKVQDKGRWSLATTSRPQSPAVRGFVGLWYRRRFSGLRSFSAVVGLRGATVPSSSGVFHRRCEMRGFFRVNFASLYQRKGRRESAVQAVLKFLITRTFAPGYSPQVGVLCVADGARRLHVCEQPSAARRLASRNRRRYTCRIT